MQGSIILWSLANIKCVAANISCGVANILHGAAVILRAMASILSDVPDILHVQHKLGFGFFKGKINFFQKVSKPNVIIITIINSINESSVS